MDLITSNPDPAALFVELEAAVRAGNSVRVAELWARLQQALLRSHHDHAELERRARELLAGTPQALRGAAGDATMPIITARAPHAHGPVLERAGSATGNLSATPATHAEGSVFPVWFGTNRKALLHPNGSLAGFGSDRAERTTLGRAEVFIPEAHRFGETGSSFWTRLKRRDLRDDHLRLQGLGAAADAAGFFAEVQAEMQAARDAGSKPQALVFIHGFNVSFEEAAIRAAQIGCDLKVPGATAFFSWPSRGTVVAYPADEATIEASEAAITRFLIDFHARCGAERIHVIAHSMGNRGLLRALQRMAANAQAAKQVKFGQIFLAAPDVDRDLFCELAGVYAQFCERATLYASKGDLAVHASHRLHDAPRAGYFEPYTVAPHVDTIAVPDFDLDLLGHSYFAQAEALLHDIFDLMRNDQAPVLRQRLKPKARPEGTVWQLLR